MNVIAEFEAIAEGRKRLEKLPEKEVQNCQHGHVHVRPRSEQIVQDPPNPRNTSSNSSTSTPRDVRGNAESEQETEKKVASLTFDNKNNDLKHPSA